MYYHPVTVPNRGNHKDIILENNIFLAPMAGASDYAYRKICLSLACGLTVTELISARGIRYSKDLKHIWPLLYFDAESQPIGIQLFGSDPIDFEYSVDRIFSDPLLKTANFIDVNMGCPVPKVVKTGAGSALMKDPQRAAEIIKSMRKHLDSIGVPITVKIRKGFDQDEDTALELSKHLVDAGVSMITIHARTRKQMYSGQADWSCIKRVKDGIKTIPIIGNGDVVDATSAKAMLDQTGADGLMVGRAAMGNPWIFKEIKHGFLNEPNAYIPSIEDRISMIQKHFTYMLEVMSEPIAAKEVRKVLGWYVKGLKNAAQLRSVGVRVNGKEDILAFCDLIRGSQNEG